MDEWRAPITGMGTYGLQKVIRHWGRSQLTPEQAIGQILLLLAV